MSSNIRLSDENVSQGSTILVVEDDPGIREALGMLLESDGYSIIKAGDGKEALEILRTHPRPRLVLLDLLMPIMDGWQFMEVIKTDAAMATIPIVIITAYADRSHGIEGREILKKPIDPSMLLAVVRKHCGDPDARDISVA